MDHAGATLAPSGVVDLEVAGALERQLGAALAGVPEGASVLLDLTGVRLLDSAGIRALLNARRLADTTGRRLRITGASGIVRNVLDLTGVSDHLLGEPA